MFSSFLIAFREALEIAILVGVSVRYLTSTSRAHFHKTVWQGLFIGLLFSAGFGFLLFRLGGELQGEGAEVLEIITSVISIILIGTFLFWLKHHQTTTEISGALENKIIKQEKLGLFFLITLSVLREGIETALFTYSSTASARSGALGGIIGGAALAALVGYLLFVSLAKIPVKKIFIITSIFLIAIAANLTSHLFEEFFSNNTVAETLVWLFIFVSGNILLFREHKKPTP